MYLKYQDINNFLTFMKNKHFPDENLFYYVTEKLDGSNVLVSVSLENNPNLDYEVYSRSGLGKETFSDFSEVEEKIKKIVTKIKELPSFLKDKLDFSPKTVLIYGE